MVQFRQVFVAAAGVTIVMTIAGMITPRSLYSDQGWGFLAL